jgi:type IV secretory pathway VirD2 relaxase
MARDDGFDLWLGRIGKDRPMRRQLGAIRARRAGKGGKRSAFSGSIIGRGSGIGRMLGSRDPASSRFSRRVVVKTRIVRLGPKGFKGAKAHLRYLERDGTTRDGGRGTLYGPGEDNIDGKEFLERGADDRHQFRFIVSPEDGAEYQDLRPVVRRLMDQMEKDLGTKLDWVAVDHFNTGHPHAHIMLRGKDELGQNLVIAREYLTQGLRERASEIVSLDLGPRTDAEIQRSRTNEVTAERLTGIDRSLLASVGDDGLVRPIHGDGFEQTLRAGRLQSLGRLGLAEEVTRGAWKLDPNLEEKLRRLGELGDIVRTMSRALREKLPERSPDHVALYEPAGVGAAPLVGRVIERGLSDEHADRHYLIVDGVDGLARYVDIGAHAEAIPENAIVRVTGRQTRAHAFDHTVAKVAEANGGRYSVDIHLRHDRTIMQDFAERHVRRLEAIRRVDGGVARDLDGSWLIAPDHIARAEAYERELTRRNPIVLETLSTRPLEQLPHHDGATWLDRELVSPNKTPLKAGFGSQVNRALYLRQQWLIEQGLAELEEGNMVNYRKGFTSALQQRELRRVGAQFSRELGLAYAEVWHGERIEGKMKGTVQVGDTKFALIEKSREFSLVPWRPVLERAIGKQVSGISMGEGIDWTIGRSRGLDIGM